MRKLDADRHEEKRQEILAAAGRCFERSGLKGASIADICREAAISPGHLYHYFESKDEIVATLSGAWLDTISERFERLLARESGIVSALVTEIGKLAPSEPNSRSKLIFELLAESTRNADIAAVLQAHSRRLRTMVVNVLRQAQERGKIDPALDAETTAAAMIAMIDGVKALALRDPRLDRRKVVDMIQGLFSTMLEHGAATPADPPGRVR